MTDTLNCVQYYIHNSTQHTLDVSCYSTHKVVSNIEGISADNHRVNEANVNGSWGQIKRKQRKTKNKYLKCLLYAVLNSDFRMLRGYILDLFG